MRALAFLIGTVHVVIVGMLLIPGVGSFDSYAVRLVIASLIWWGGIFLLRHPWFCSIPCGRLLHLLLSGIYGLSLLAFSPLLFILLWERWVFLFGLISYFVGIGMLPNTLFVYSGKKECRTN